MKELFLREGILFRGTASGPCGRPRRQSVRAADENAPPVRRWLVLGSGWTPSLQGATPANFAQPKHRGRRLSSSEILVFPDDPAQVVPVFDTPSQTAPLTCIEGNDFTWCAGQDEKSPAANPV